MTLIARRISIKGHCNFQNTLQGLEVTRKTSRSSIHLEKSIYFRLFYVLFEFRAEGRMNGCFRALVLLQNTWFYWKIQQKNCQNTCRHDQVLHEHKLIMPLYLFFCFGGTSVPILTFNTNLSKQLTCQPAFSFCWPKQAKNFLVHVFSHWYMNSKLWLLPK